MVNFDAYKNLILQHTELLGWHDYARAYDLSNHVENATYAIAYCEQKPPNFVLPCDLKETIYIGMSNGYMYDQKNRSAGAGRLKMNLQKRFIIHNSCLTNRELAEESDERRYSVFHEMYPEFTDKTSLFSLGQKAQKNIYYNIVKINESGPINKDNMIAFTKSIESLGNALYSVKFGTSPLMNLAEAPKKRVAASISNRQLSGSTIKNFLDEAVVC